MPEGGRYQAVLSTDDKQFGGQGRIDHDAAHLSQPEGQPGTAQLSRNHARILYLVQGLALWRSAHVWDVAMSTSVTGP